ncbi:putative protein [Arabidopsis thaliana]|uniref:Small RNA 2'-O-methyltransferase n=1 Tax=Arabidopsis thaliana TaxID=3702 RepID=Q9SUC1_ARATH|nr:putative protein [Arabidopsis thaliana]CAB79092.1 putative protein [Arabidopsis thaliana]
MAGEEKQTLTPKEMILQKFGVKAIYRIEEVHVSSNDCLYRCHLQLPEFSVVSNVFKRKKDSEQSAAELALEKLGIQSQDDDDVDITVDEAWNNIVERIKYIFSDEFLSVDHPLGGHLRAALQRDGERCGSLPVSVIATFDAKINSRCKVIDPSVESDPILLMSYVMKAAAKLPDYIVVSPHVDSLRRKKPYPPATIKALATTHVKSIKAEAVHLQCTVGGEEVVKPVTLDISSGRYYLDIIADKLGLKDGSQVMISRTIGKTSSGYECRVYAAIPKLKSSDNSWKAREKRPIIESSHLEKSRNAKASFVCGVDIHGDAIVASVGYPWRICCGISPNGIYKLSREAIIAAQLPFSFTTKSTWRGPFPREILCMFCRQQQLVEPIFTISTAPVKPMSCILRSYQKLKDSECDEKDSECDEKDSECDDSEYQYTSKGKEEIPESGTGYRCEVKILSKSQDLVLDCSSRKFYEKENHAIQNASLNALSWLSRLFDEGDGDPLQICYTDDHLDAVFQQRILMKEAVPKGHFRNRDEMNQYEDQVRIQTITKGSLVSICYSVYLDVDADFSKDGKSKKELIESNEEIEFEVGNGSMNPHLEAVVTQLVVGQYARFLTNAPAEDLFVTAATGTQRDRSLLSDVAGFEYCVRLLGVKGPTEKRIEADFFKPSLSKQRLEYVVKHIKESSASTLVDFGCGSGSLLASILDCPTSLQTIAGVDISHKSLTRAAKVIEHMEEDQASQFGKTVLSLFRPKLLIVSTPNIEYNTNFHKSGPPNHPKNRSMSSQLPKFRNQDHKFEWTRKQFKQWASKLAKRHNYSVYFSGVGGSGKGDPGFASQIVVFRRISLSNIVEKVSEGSMQPYKIIWKWSKRKWREKD